MTPESDPGPDPFALLTSESAVDRQRGARALIGRVALDDIARVREIRAREVDSFVQQALDKVILIYGEPSASFGDSDGWMQLHPTQLTDDIRAEAIQYVTKVMLHEMRPLVGDVFRATREVMGDEFRGSQPHEAVRRIQDFLTAMSRLNEAAAPPAIIQFDLVGLLSAEIGAMNTGGIEILLSRSDSLVVLGDPSLLRLAVQNCLRNAIEASDGTMRAIVVNCGANQFDNWVSILDEGIGLPDAGDQVLEPGNSTKTRDEHFGMGLPIAQRAMQSFGGSVELARREHRGTACQLRWAVDMESL